MKTIGIMAGILFVAVLVGGCNKEQQCVDASKPALDSCQAKSTEMQDQLNDLKRQLAQALASPGSIKVDPSVLMIDGKPIEVKKAEGALSAEEVIGALTQNKAALEPCYTRALKKDSSLHHRRIVLNVAFQVAPSGVANSINITPNYNAEMTDCMKRAIRRWKFPAFSGQPVGVESPVTFTPKS